MGSFSYTCCVSGLPIEGGDKVRFLVLCQNPYHTGRSAGSHACYSTDYWFPRAFPLRATYDDYGTVEGLEPGPGLDMWLDGLREDLVERPWGDNTCHDVPTSKEMAVPQLLDALREGRMLVRDRYGDARMDLAHQAACREAEAKGLPPPTAKKGPEIPVGVPTRRRVERRLAAAGCQPCPASDAFMAPGFIVNRLRLGVCSVREAGRDDTGPALGRYLETLSAAYEVERVGAQSGQQLGQYHQDDYLLVRARPRAEATASAVLEILRKAGIEPVRFTGAQPTADVLTLLTIANRRSPGIYEAAGVVYVYATLGEVLNRTSSALMRYYVWTPLGEVPGVPGVMQLTKLGEVRPRAPVKPGKRAAMGDESPRQLGLAQAMIREDVWRRLLRVKDPDPYSAPVSAAGLRHEATDWLEECAKAATSGNWQHRFVAEHQLEQSRFVSRDPAPFVLGLEFSWKRLAERVASGDLARTSPEIQGLVRDWAEFKCICDVLVDTCHTWHPAASGPQSGRWRAHGALHETLAKLCARHRR
jgi:hypothetical protein